jgi:hypothetical protein
MIAEKERAEQLSGILSRVAVQLDIPDYLVQEIIDKYDEIGSWLNEPETALARYNPQVYSQGSFRLGTAIRPVSDNADYDIDSVCVLDITKEQTTQYDLKHRVGDRLKENARYRRIMSEGRRCWTLTYSEFHLDVLPAIPNTERGESNIWITDKELRFWQPSNPVDYSKWFFGRMRHQFQKERERLAEVRKAEVEDVPEWQVRTLLQRVVQLFKRHRDVYFEDDQDDKPISIIITTLAAHAYNGEANLFEALLNVAFSMENFIEDVDGKKFVRNPVDSTENFADKWQTNPQRQENFYRWLAKLKADLERAETITGVQNVGELFGESLGTRVVQKAINEHMDALYKQRESGQLKMSKGTGALGVTGAVTVPRHTNFGED